MKIYKVFDYKGIELYFTQKPSNETIVAHLSQMTKKYYEDLLNRKSFIRNNYTSIGQFFDIDEIEVIEIS